MKFLTTKISQGSVFLIVLTLALLTACGGGGGSASPTGLVTDGIPPTVTATSPENDTPDFAFNSAISATFNEAMKASSVNTNTFILSKAGIAQAGNVEYSGTTATFTPISQSGKLDPSTAYVATITTAVQDEAGNSMTNNKTWSFTTSALPDTALPTITSTSPLNTSTGVSVNAPITATFSEAMTPSTINATNFTLINGANSVEGIVTYNATTATFTPNSPLAYLTQYTAIINTGVKDTSGNAMESNHIWVFTTAVDDRPTLTAVSPNQGSNSGGTTITLTGSNFVSGATVTVGGAAATNCVVINSNSMTCTTAANSAGVKDVVVNASGSQATLVGGFTYLTAFIFNPVISSNTLNYNLRTAAIEAGWIQTAQLNATVTVSNGGVIGSASTASPAFDTGANFPAGSVLTLVVNAGGKIEGKGGIGVEGSAGLPGGVAMQAQYNISVTNNGRVGGGGGGGGAAGDTEYAGGGPSDGTYPNIAGGVGAGNGGANTWNGGALGMNGGAGQFGGYFYWVDYIEFHYEYSGSGNEGYPGGAAGAAVSGKAYINGGGGIGGEVYGVQN